MVELDLDAAYFAGRTPSLPPERLPTFERHTRGTYTDADVSPNAVLNASGGGGVGSRSAEVTAPPSEATGGCAAKCSKSL